jgi:hypothetical protein
MTRYQTDELRELESIEKRFWFVSVVGTALAIASVGSAVASLILAVGG